MDVPGVLQPLSSADEAERRAPRQEADLQARFGEISGSQNDFKLAFPHKC